MAAEIHIDGRFWTWEFPGVAQAQPFVCTFDLPTIPNLLAKNAEFVPDAVADRGDFQCCEGVHITGGKPTQSPIAQARLGFLFEQFFEVQPGFLHSPADLIVDTEINQTVSQARPSRNSADR